MARAARRALQVLRMMRAVDAIRQFDSHAEKASGFFPFVDTSYEPSRPPCDGKCEASRNAPMRRRLIRRAGFWWP